MLTQGGVDADRGNGVFEVATEVAAGGPTTEHLGPPASSTEAITQAITQGNARFRSERDQAGGIVVEELDHPIVGGGEPIQRQERHREVAAETRSGSSGRR